MKNNILFILFLGGALFTVNSSCKKEKEPATELPDAPYTLSYGNLPAPNLPGDNPLTREGVKLGRMLFYETKLSGNNTQSCASCHMQAFAFNDTARFSIGIEGLKGKRNAMSVFNMAWNTNGFFWDGRASLLRHQALMPIQDPLEMKETLANVVSKLQATETYPAQFRKAFGTDVIDTLLISKALEQFMLAS